MMKFAVKSLITLVVTSSALLLTPMRSDAQVNMKLLAQVAESCQKDVHSRSYYQKMLLDNIRVSLEECVSSRYHYSLVLAQFPSLISKGEIIPGYPGSVVVGKLAMWYSQIGGNSQLLDCFIAQDTSSDVCSLTMRWIAKGDKIRSNALYSDNYLIYVCPSCVVAHDEMSGSRTVILKAFMKWFLSLDKPERREVISLLGDDLNAQESRWSLIKQSDAALKEYGEARARVQQQDRERRRQELLGQ